MSRNSSSIYSPTFAHTLSDHSLNYNTKNCWESLEDHFICLDKSNDVYGRPFIPPSILSPRDCCQRGLEKG